VVGEMDISILILQLYEIIFHFQFGALQSVFIRSKGSGMRPLNSFISSLFLFTLTFSSSNSMKHFSLLFNNSCSYTQVSDVI
jgi:hypothetical protein